MLVNSEGFEPPTSWAVTRCTIQLCYESFFAKASADAVLFMLYRISEGGLVHRSLGIGGSKSR